MFFLLLLLAIVMLILAYALSSDKGDNTRYARGKTKLRTARPKMRLVELNNDSDSLHIH
ncbi:hypothetical protein OCL06_13005 [Alteromonas sp. ASW11-19]|uniref:Uncharacterized protein n=1 Tax=Alteromonas salexigens TaxID=2982530 RepID=A0ABT2VST6_9ALTE|nr:hypothetical protein [Alteromonas salexigens]MCU7555508.1 hypothetical protein [Alteromonas salexigens]